MSTLQMRKQDLKRVIRGLDITPSMFKNAEEKYKNIANFLNEHGLNINISLQGSFAIGTATKPYSNGKDKAYDIDVICQFEKTDLTSKEIRDYLLSTLNSSNIYSDRLTEWPKCFTLEYAKLSDYDFSLDLVPTLPEENSDIGKTNVSPEYLTEILKIATNDGEYGWYTINPKGYQRWFNNINNRFAMYGRENRMKQVFEENSLIYASIEEIPEYFNKSSLQEAVQILKRSRDIYFSKKYKDDKKPSSIIITTFAAIVASEMPTDIDSVDLAIEIVKRMSLYSKNTEFTQNVSPIIKKGAIWEFLNPVNSKDNLLDLWNNDEEISSLFFEWVEYAIKGLNKIIDETTSDHISILGNSFGNEIVDKLFSRHRVEEVTTGVKPYHE